MLTLWIAAALPLAADTALLKRDNLMAWCIVPFDAKKRGPEERAAMLKELGLSRLAYDWRDEHVAPTSTTATRTSRSSRSSSMP